MKQVKIVNKVGLHARPAAMFSTEAKRFKSEVVLIKDGKEINAKSPIRIMGANIEYNDDITIKADGPDADQAEQALADLLNSWRD